jgi:hypothetical protein
MGGVQLRWAKEKVDDVDKSASLADNAPPRRPTESLAPLFTSQEAIMPTLRPQARNRTKTAIFLAIGTGIGAACGVATHAIAQCVALGAALGVAVGYYVTKRG